MSSISRRATSRGAGGRADTAAKVADTAAKVGRLHWAHPDWTPQKIAYLSKVATLVR